MISHVPSGSPLSYLEAELEGLRQQDLLRLPAPPTGALVLCSNDYLGYAVAPFPLENAEGPPAPGAGASRLVSGQHVEHTLLESSLAAWVGLQEALLFSSGYAANVGLLSALAGRGDVVVSDELNHASIIDGCRLSRARVVVTPHLDVDAIGRALAEASAARRRFVVTEAYFSMDADVPALAELRRLCDRFDAVLIVDEAHSLGIFGSEGRGLCHEAGVVPDVLVGTLGKAIGLQGAFVAGSLALKTWLWNRARSFVFSTGGSPWFAHQTRLRVMQVAADDAARARLDAIVSRVRTALSGHGAPVLPSRGPILPWLVGDPGRALELRDRLLSQGLFVQAIRPPTVPAGTARLRVTLHAGLDDAQVSFLIDRLGSLVAGGA